MNNKTVEEGGKMDTPKEQLDQFRCQNCGGTVKWNVAQQRLECSACRTAVDMTGMPTKINRHNVDEYDAQSETPLAEGITVMKCNGCGAELEFDEDDTAKVCPLCGATNVWTERHTGEAAPDGVLPFKIDKQNAQQLFRDWVKKRWFAPNKLKQAYQEGKLEGMYVPFWTFDADTYAAYQGKGGKEYTYTDSNGDDATGIRWTKVNGAVSKKFRDVQVVAAASQVTQAIDEVLPYDMDTKVPFDSVYLSGYSAERYVVPMPTALETAKRKMRSRLEEMAKTQIKESGYDEAQITKMDVQMDKAQYKHMLFPAWFSTYSYGGKQYLYIINGQTGEVGGKRPYSIPKIAALIAVIIIAIWILFGCSSSSAAGLDTTTGSKAQQYTTEQQYTAQQYTAHQQSIDNVEAVTEKEWN